MPKTIYFELNEKDYDYLSNFLKKGKAFVREVKKAEALLLLHNQFPVSDRSYYWSIPANNYRTETELP